MNLVLDVGQSLHAPVRQVRAGKPHMARVGGQWRVSPMPIQLYLTSADSQQRVDWNQALASVAYKNILGKWPPR